MPPKQDVLAALGSVPDLGSLVAPAFLERFQLAAPMQYGIVCRDVPAGIRRLESLGAGPFLHARTRAPGWTERGERKAVVTDMALGYVEHQQVELLGPGEGTDLYAEKIPADGGFALHHVGIAQLGMHRIKPALAGAGFPAVVELGLKIGPLYSVDVAYFDTRDELGFYVEILEFTMLGKHAPMTEALVTRLARLQRLLGG